MAAGAASGGLTLRRLVKRNGAVEAVVGFDTEIRRGEFLTLLGPSGSGKTTLFMMIAEFQSATEGDILLDSQPITSTPAKRQSDCHQP